MAVGNRIFSEITRPDPEIIQMFAGLPSSNVNDEMNRLFCMHDYMRLMNPEKAVQLLGPAVTVKVPLGDNLFFHQALEMAQPGDVIVVDAGSGCNRAIAGEIMLRYAQTKGLAGIVVDGCLRDLDGIKALNMPIYAKGVTPQGPFKNGPGEVNGPVSCGGQVVFPGDILVGDADGIVVVRRQDAEAIANAADAKTKNEQVTFALMESDLVAYCRKHQGQTKGWFGEKEVQVLKSYEQEY